MSVEVRRRRADLLRRKISGCTECNLHLYCKAPVPPAIPSSTATPELLIIGEAPGSQEDREGQPFHGPAGQLIFRWLKIEMGLSRAQTIISNAVSCRPTTSDKGKTNRAPSKDELFRCESNVARVVDFYMAAGGQWILLLGATALKVFVPEAKVSAWSGRPFVLKHRKGLVSLMATNHPAAALRDPNYGPAIRRHLNYLAAVKKDPVTFWPDTCMCGKEVVVYDGMGVAWCEAHRGFRREERWVVAMRKEQGKLAV